MEEIKTKGIILNSNDFGEADKLATVFSLEYGKIVVKFNGVRKQKAKLKSLAQPFSFVEIECFKRGDFFTVKTGLVVDSFPKITNNFTTTICAYIIMEIIAKILPKNKVEPNIFLAVSNALDNMETNNPYTTTIYFILQFFDLLGETLSIDMADNHVFLDLGLGNFCNYKTPNSIEIDKKCYSVLSAVFNKSQQEFPDALCKMTLKMLNNVFRTKYDIEINSFNFL